MSLAGLPCARLAVAGAGAVVCSTTEYDALPSIRVAGSTEAVGWIRPCVTNWSVVGAGTPEASETRSGMRAESPAGRDPTDGSPASVLR
ncbi:hypothetical protein ACFWIO_14025 [Streptomyces diastatochromogenes]|uniref:hypothetical protein n=1 Tax=Streptomyces diastatochromogenes TaxID=42236 RepID=UPI003646EC94